MKPSDRVQLIKAIAESLTKFPSREINLTLRQFKLPTDDPSYWPELIDYVITKIDNASDEKLIAVAEHLSIGSLPKASTQTADCWNAGQFRLFLCHLATDKVFVTALHIRTATGTRTPAGAVDASPWPPS